MNKRRMELLLCVGLVAASSMHAQGPGGGERQPRAVLLKLDADHDGTLSSAEISVASSVLASMDTNGDGQLTSFEFLPRQQSAGAVDPEEMVKRLMLLDRNADGVITADELPERLASLMARADGDHDGKLTPDEIRATFKTQSGPAGRQRRGADVTRMDPILNVLDADHDGVISAGEIAHASVALMALDVNGDGILTPDELKMLQATPTDRVNHLLDEWDTDKDGKLTKAECPDRMQELFDKIDTNKDSFLDKAELIAYFVSQPAQRPRESEKPQ